MMLYNFIEKSVEAHMIQRFSRQFSGFSSQRLVDRVFEKFQKTLEDLMRRDEVLWNFKRLYEAPAGFVRSEDLMRFWL